MYVQNIRFLMSSFLHGLIAAIDNWIEPNVCLKLPGLCPNYFCGFPSVFRSTLPQLCPNYSCDISSIFRSTMPQFELCPARLCPNYTPTMPFAPTMPRVLPQLCFGRLPIRGKYKFIISIIYISHQKVSVDVLFIFE